MALTNLSVVDYEDVEVDFDVPSVDETVGLDLDEIINEVQSLVQYAVDHIQSQFITPWEDAEALYNGATNIAKEEGRSQVTATKVRDTIRAVKPSLMRVFATSDRIAEYRTMNIQFEPIAEQQTILANTSFWTYAGYNVLSDVIYDACVKGTAITKTWNDKQKTAEFFEITGATQEQINGFDQTPDVTVTAIYTSESSSDGTSKSASTSS